MTEIIEEAFERCGLEVRSGYDFRTARRSLNLLFMEWANRGLNLWTVTEATMSLTQGVSDYNLPQDTVDIIEQVIRQNPGTSQQTDISISRIALPTYATIPNKITQGRPIQIYVNRQEAPPRIRIWPSPNDASYTLVYWYLRRIQDAGSVGNTTMDVPFLFVPAMIAGLAYNIAVKKAPDRLDMLKASYEEEWQLAAEENRDRAPVRFVPRIGYIGAGGVW